MNLWSFIVLIGLCGVIVNGVVVPFPEKVLQSNYDYPGELPTYPNYIAYIHSNATGPMGQDVPVNTQPNLPNTFVTGGSWLPGFVPTQIYSGFSALWDVLGMAFTNVGNALGAALNAAVSGIGHGIGVAGSGIFGNSVVNTATTTYSTNRIPQPTQPAQPQLVPQPLSPQTPPTPQPQTPQMPQPQTPQTPQPQTPQTPQPQTPQTPQPQTPQTPQPQTPQTPPQGTPLLPAPQPAEPTP